MQRRPDPPAKPCSHVAGQAGLAMLIANGCLRHRAARDGAAAIPECGPVGRGPGCGTPAGFASQAVGHSGVVEADSPAVAVDSPAARSVAALLLPEAEIVPFEPRPELGDLMAWCRAAGRVGVRLVTGQGGAGKTRLAIELARDLREAGWRASWVPFGGELEAAGAARESGRPAVLLVDHAETRADLPQLLADVAEGTDGPRLRVLLLARGAGEWWEQLISAADYLPAELLSAERPITLGPLAGGPGRQEVFDHALAKFAARLGAGPPAAKLTLTDPDAVIALVHAAALLAVLDHLAPDGDPRSPRPGDAHPQTGAEPLSGLLRHEAAYWARSAESAGLRLDPGVARRAVAAACLAGTDPDTGTAELLSRLPDFAGSAERRAEVARWLDGLYPAERDAEHEPAGWAGSLRPDLIAEHLVAEVLAQEPELVPGLLAGLAEARAVRALTVLGRAAFTQPGAAEALARALAADPDRLALPAVTVAVETNPAVGDLLAEAVASQPVTAETLETLASAIPYPSAALAGTAVTVLGRLAGESAEGSAERARWLTKLSTRLTDLGQGEQALAAIEETVDTRRTLAKAEPEIYAPQLANALNNQSKCLANLGRWEEALETIEETVEIRRALAEAAPEVYLPNLATALNNESGCLAEVGWREDALETIDEAVAIRRELVTERPDSYEPDLAMYLNNQSACLADLGRREDALAAIDEAVAIRRELAQTQPAEFRPDLATALNDQSLRLADLGRREDALAAIDEAVAIRRELAQTQPAEFRPDLATALNDQSLRLADLGRREDALAAIDEAVAIRRELAQTQPAEFRPDLATALNNQSTCLADLGRREEALTAVGEATEIYRRLAQARPDTFLPDLAMTLNNQSACLADIGRREEALTAIEEAITTYRRLARARPDAFLPDLALSLNNQSPRLAELGRPDEALTAIEEAITIRRALAEAQPDAFLPDLAMSLNNQSGCLAGLGRWAAALTAIEEAILIRRALAEASPDAFLPDLAMSLKNLATILSAAGKHAEAEAARTESAIRDRP